eukprot:m.45623 g.45623  ORF g.45623 m.45623 type:complete len:863 (+) comp6675_c0_seq1:47-2635(+)
MPSQALPPKEQAQFKKILKYYEMKQYKMGLKAAKYILSQPEFAEHGETLALKGLTLNCLNRKEEAYKLVKKGISNDMKSHVCWHVYGLLYRSDKDYGQAIKCYRKALHFDPDNSQILRDLSLLQIQMRDLDGFLQTRHALMTLKPTVRVSWLAYAVGFHLQGKLDLASQVLMAWRDNPANDDKKYEASELLMYNAALLREDGKAEAALAFLARHADAIVDKLAMTEMRGELLLSLGRKKEAEEIYRELLDRNVECTTYYTKLEEAVGLGPGAPASDRTELYHSFLKDRPRAHAPKRLPLFFHEPGTEFTRLMDAYLRPNIRKGMTPVFRNIRKMYSDPAKAKIVGDLVQGYIANLRKTPSKFDGDEASPEEMPTTLIYTLSVYAQHLDWLGDRVKALEVINEAIDHTPTLLELYMTKAKILKHGGDRKEAAHWLNYARELDTADRFINSKCVKYMLRAGDIDKAEETAGLFTRESSDPIAQLSEMQCIWFETESADAQVQALNAGMALKKLHAVAGHFDTMVEDQFDFHTYCMRKMTLRAYVEMLRTEDHLRDHPLYYRAAMLATRIYIDLHDAPFGSKERDEQEARTAGMTPAERKKMLSRLKKAEAKGTAANGGAGTTAAPSKKGKKGKKGKGKAAPSTGGGGSGAAVNATTDEKHDDPKGEELARTKTPLVEASKFLAPLIELSPNRLPVQVLAFEVAWRKKKVLQMLRALRRALSISAEGPQTLRLSIMLLHFFETSAASLHPTVKAVAQEEMDKILGAGVTADAILKKVTAMSSSLPHLLVATEMRQLLGAPPEEATQPLTSLKSLDGLTGADLKTCRRAIYFLKTKVGEDRSPPFITACAAAFPLAKWDDGTFVDF